MIDNDPVDILLVEDNADDAELAIRALRKSNLNSKLLRVDDGEAALEFFFGQDGYVPRPRLVLLDLKMPKVDGLEVLRLLRADPRTKYVPVVVLTSSREDPDLEAAYALGANSFITKPVDFDKFVAAIANLASYWILLNELPKSP